MTAARKRAREGGEWRGRQGRCRGVGVISPAKERERKPWAGRREPGVLPRGREQPRGDDMEQKINQFLLCDPSDVFEWAFPWDGTTVVMGAALSSQSRSPWEGQSRVNVLEYVLGVPQPCQGSGTFWMRACVMVPGSTQWIFLLWIYLTLLKPLQAPVASSSKKPPQLSTTCVKKYLLVFVLVSLSSCKWSPPYSPYLGLSWFCSLVTFPLSHHFSKPTSPLAQHGGVPHTTGYLMTTEASVVFTMALAFVWCPQGGKAGRDIPWVPNQAQGQSLHSNQHGETAERELCW